MGLDDERCWELLSKANRFLWPGPAPAAGATGRRHTTVAYGQVPYALLEEIRTKFIAAIRARRAGMVPRSE